MQPSQPKWWTKERKVSVGVFAGFTLLNVLMNCVGGMIAMYTLGPPPPPGQVRVADVCAWVVLFPVMAAQHLNPGMPPWVGTLLLLANPFIYGLMGWFAWRMWRLMRRKAAE